MRFFKWEIISAKGMVGTYEEVQTRKNELINKDVVLGNCQRALSKCREDNATQGAQLAKFKQKALVNHPITGKMRAFRKMSKAAQTRFFAEDEKGR